MTGERELRIFSLLTGRGFEDWLAEKETEAVKVLAMGEGKLLHQAQGKYALIQDMKALLEKGKHLR